MLFISKLLSASALLDSISECFICLFGYLFCEGRKCYVGFFFVCGLDVSCSKFLENGFLWFFPMTFNLVMEMVADIQVADNGSLFCKSYVYHSIVCAGLPFD